MTRAEHLAWCKERATQEYNYYAVKEGFDVAKRNACCSMLSDLGKHSDTKSSQQIAAMLMLVPMHSWADVKRFIEGFN